MFLPLELKNRLPRREQRRADLLRRRRLLRHRLLPLLPRRPLWHRPPRLLLPLRRPRRWLRGQSVSPVLVYRMFPAIELNRSCATVDEGIVAVALYEYEAAEEGELSTFTGTPPPTCPRSSRSRPLTFFFSFRMPAEQPL